MAVTVKGAVVGLKSARLDFGDAGDLNFTWRTGMMTGAQVDALRESTGSRSTYETLAAAIESWDLLGDDGQPLPLDADVLYRTVPMQLVGQIFDRMRDDGAGEVNGAS